MVRQIMQEELKTALFREITVEKGPRNQGDPEKRVEMENVSVLDFLAVYLPRIEAAMRGMQADLDRAKNNISVNNAGLEMIGKTLLGMEKNARLLAEASDAIRAQGLMPLSQLKLIKDGDGN